MKLHIGIDDTDSPEGGCTTYIGAIIIDILKEKGIEFLDYPHLIRLNPNIPFKTRGNGAVALHISTDETKYNDIKNIIVNIVSEYSEREVRRFSEKTNPGICFLKGEVPQILKEFYKKALQELCTIRQAETIAKKVDADVIKIRKGRGIIGALAAIGATLEEYTYELILYRTKEFIGTRRKIDKESVFYAHNKTYPQSFDLIDPSTKKLILCPNTPCPVFAGIRGYSVDAVKKALKYIIPEEPIERSVIYKTNQATDCHFTYLRYIKDIKIFGNVIAIGMVCRNPITITGGHVIFSIKDETGSIDCAAYEPTREFRNIVRDLVIGDIVEVYGGVKLTTKNHILTINLEKIKIIKLKEIKEKINPICKCGKSMSSMGKNQGYRCKKCRTKVFSSIKFKTKKRNLMENKIYVVPARSRRHLTKFL
ncbi:MAG TPA: DUF1743 domain-containing protein [Methanosarcinales archaeon]|nr:DUF1743 domain-containing protein [Methanosarcinales archaeon]